MFSLGANNSQPRDQPVSWGCSACVFMCFKCIRVEENIRQCLCSRGECVFWLFSPERCRVSMYQWERRQGRKGTNWANSSESKSSLPTHAIGLFFRFTPTSCPLRVFVMHNVCYRIILLLTGNLSKWKPLKDSLIYFGVKRVILKYCDISLDNVLIFECQESYF